MSVAVVITGELRTLSNNLTMSTALHLLREIEAPLGSREDLLRLRDCPHPLEILNELVEDRLDLQRTVISFKGLMTGAQNPPLSNFRRRRGLNIEMNHPKNFERLVFGCMDSYDSESRPIFQH